MKKIISLFRRDYDGNRLVIDEVLPGAEWVANGEGIATRKWDGTCCKIEEGVFYKRFDAKHGKTPPEGFVPAQDPDPVTGHWPGWMKVGDGPEDRWFREGFANSIGDKFVKFGTFELVGPKVNGNRDKFEKHILVAHGEDIIENAPRTFEGLKAFFADQEIEGIVWHHPDGRKVKIKKKDFGFKW